MTEDIIIDGVNVTECEQRFGDNECALLDQYFCADNPDCYYKQLKRLQMENEALIAENEDMKKSFVSHSEFMNIIENNPNINWEATAKENIYLINKYGKALKEIRGILPKGRMFYEGYFDDVDKAINKINEVLGEVDENMSSNLNPHYTDVKEILKIVEEGRSN